MKRSRQCPIFVDLCYDLLQVRGLGERAIATKRQCARIIENMSKLVDEPSDVAPFLPKLLPLLEIAKVYITPRVWLEVTVRILFRLPFSGYLDLNHRF